MAAKVPASVATPLQCLIPMHIQGRHGKSHITLNVRSGQEPAIPSVGRLAAGAAITVIGEQRGTDGNTWYQIQYTGTGRGGEHGLCVIRLREASRWPIPRILILKHILPHRDFRRATRTGSGSFMPQYPNWVFKAKNTRPGLEYGH